MISRLEFLLYYIDLGHDSVWQEKLFLGVFSFKKKIHNSTFGVKYLSMQHILLLKIGKLTKKITPTFQ